MTRQVVLFVVEVYTVTAILCGHHGADGRAAARALFRLGRRPRPAWALGPVAARTLARRTRQEPS